MNKTCSSALICKVSFSQNISMAPPIRWLPWKLPNNAEASGLDASSLTSTSGSDIDRTGAAQESPQTEPRNSTPDINAEQSLELAGEHHLCPGESPNSEFVSALHAEGFMRGAENLELAKIAPPHVPPPIFSQLAVAGSATIDAIHSGVAQALISGIRMISSERDRDEIIRWFMKAREILGRDSSSAEKAKVLYKSTDTARFAQLLANTAATGLNNYYGADLPLALKVAVPVTLIGAGYFGMQGAGLLAFGTGIGLPVVLLLFLGTAGATTVLEAFIKDRNVRDPLTKLLLMFVAFESTRRAKKELLQAMRADAMVPVRAPVPPASEEILPTLMAMDPITFERHVMSFFEQDGHPTGLTPRSNDFGVDGYVFHPDGVIIVQCKRYHADNPIGRPAIQQFKGVIEEQRAFKGYFVTTSRFTEEAAESAAKSHRIILVNGEEIVRWHKAGRKLL